MRALILKCDVCRETTEAVDLPDTWACVEYVFSSSNVGKDKILIYEVCSPKCYLEQLKRCYEQSLGHNDILIEGHSRSFTERLLKYFLVQDYAPASKQDIILPKQSVNQELTQLPLELEKPIVLYQKYNITESRGNNVKSIEIGGKKFTKVTDSDSVKIKAKPKCLDVTLAPRKRGGQSEETNFIKIINPEGVPYYIKRSEYERRLKWLRDHPENEISTKYPEVKTPTEHLEVKTPTDHLEDIPYNKIREFEVLKIVSRYNMEGLAAKINNSAAMEEMKNKWGYDRRFNSGLSDRVKMEVPSLPLLEYEDKWVIFIPKSNMHYFERCIEDLLEEISINEDEIV